MFPLTYSKHLHEKLLLFLVRLRLRSLVDFVAAGGQEAVVIMEEDGTPVLLLETKWRTENSGITS